MTTGMGMYDIVRIARARMRGFRSLQSYIRSDEAGGIIFIVT